MLDAEQVRAFGEAVVSIFAIVDPIGGLPVFVALTEGATPDERRRVLRLAGLAALGIILTMALVGQFLLHSVFHIGIEEFSFGGGLLLVVIGIRAIIRGPARRQALPADADRNMEQEGLAVSPIASPMLVGPGCIVNVMLIVNHHGRPFALAACLVAFLFVILILNYTHLILRLMGRLVATAVGRVMEIFIVAIGVKFCFQALARTFPGLLK